MDYVNKYCLAPCSNKLKAQCLGSNEDSALVYVMNVFSACVLHLIIEASQMDSRPFLMSGSEKIFP